RRMSSIALAMGSVRKIKKQGFNFCQGEIDPNVSGLAVPVRFGSKEVPLALTLVASQEQVPRVSD
ncbi:hypothetical protein, partial [Serratia marcescens]|uniref:hypothetical protein n=1 Tax=Serratia marcescens TaxID=615 RepID=UPI0019546329